MGACEQTAQTVYRRLKSVEEAEREGLLALSTDRPKPAAVQNQPPAPPPAPPQVTTRSLSGSRVLPKHSDSLATDDPRAEAKLQAQTAAEAETKFEVKGEATGKEGNPSASEPKPISRAAAAAAKLSARISAPTMRR